MTSEDASTLASETTKRFHPMGPQGRWACIGIGLSALVFGAVYLVISGNGFSIVFALMGLVLVLVGGVGVVPKEIGAQVGNSSVGVKYDAIGQIIRDAIAHQPKDLQEDVLRRLRDLDLPNEAIDPVIEEVEKADDESVQPAPPGPPKQIPSESSTWILQALKDAAKLPEYALSLAGADTWYDATVKYALLDDRFIRVCYLCDRDPSQNRFYRQLDILANGESGELVAVLFLTDYSNVANRIEKRRLDIQGGTIPNHRKMVPSAVISLSGYSPESASKEIGETLSRLFLFNTDAKRQVPQSAT